MRLARVLCAVLTGFFLALTVSGNKSRATPVPPNPILYLTSQEFFSAGGKNFIRYRYDVLNKADYPAELFAAAPALPPCGTNTNASRTWVDFYTQNGTRL
jgi:hypothetical protein